MGFDSKRRAHCRGAPFRLLSAGPPTAKAIANKKAAGPDHSVTAAVGDQFLQKNARKV
jgi:hypothetical protein